MNGKFDILALYGAILSTVLGLLRILDEVRRLRKPTLIYNIFQMTTHAKDGSIDDMAVEITLENNSPINRNLNNLSVGLLNNPRDRYPAVARQAEYLDSLADYPIAIAPYASLILYSFERRLKPVYEHKYGPGSNLPKPVVIMANFAGIKKPIIRVIGTYCPDEGIRSEEEHGVTVSAA